MGDFLTWLAFGILPLIFMWRRKAPTVLCLLALGLGPISFVIVALIKGWQVGLYIDRKRGVPRNSKGEWIPFANNGTNSRGPM